VNSYPCGAVLYRVAIIQNSLGSALRAQRDERHPGKRLPTIPPAELQMLGIARGIRGRNNAEARGSGIGVLTRRFARLSHRFVSASANADLTSAKRSADDPRRARS